MVPMPLVALRSRGQSRSQALAGFHWSLRSQHHFQCMTLVSSGCIPVPLASTTGLAPSLLARCSIAAPRLLFLELTGTEIATESARNPQSRHG